MIGTTLLWDYFEPIAQTVPGVRHVAQSDANKMDRLAQASVLDDIYPAVFMLRPKYRFVDNGADQYYAAYNLTFYVFAQCAVGDDESADAAFDQTEQMAMAVLAKFRDDHRETSFVDFEFKTATLEPVSLMTGMDSTVGYEVKCVLSLQANAIFS